MLSPDTADSTATSQEPAVAAAESLRTRGAPLEMGPEEFRRAGHALVDRIAELLATLPSRPVSPGETPPQIRAALGDGPLPETGEPAEAALEAAARLLFDHSTFNGHPRFWGYITSPPAPIGVLGELLAAAVNPNCGAWALSPMASEIEAQTVRWIAQLIGYAPECGGVLVSGGNMANFVGLLAARKTRMPWDVRTAGLAAGSVRPRIYASAETHTWLHKAADLFGFGLDAVRWIPVDDELRMDVQALHARLREDASDGDLPLLVVGTAGSVGTGAVDPLPEIAALCREHGVWFHVDGAYGALAAGCPGAPPDLEGLAEADSVAVDPHKWLYAPLEAGCALVRDPAALRDAFSFRPPYYRFEEAEPIVNYFEHGPQNSRGFRALKVWLLLRAVGRDGYRRMIADDIRLAHALDRLVRDHTELEALTCALSIATFRYVPAGVKPGEPAAEEYLDRLNEELLARLQRGGEAYISNAVIRGRFALRACIVNFRTTLADIEALPPLVARIGREVDAAARPPELAGAGG